MPALNAGRDMALVQIQRRQNGTGSESFVFMVAGHARMFSWDRGQVGRSVGDGLKAGLFIHRNGNDRRALFTGSLRFILQRNVLINQQHRVPHPNFKGGIAFFQIILARVRDGSRPLGRGSAVRRPWPPGLIGRRLPRLLLPRAAHAEPADSASKVRRRSPVPLASSMPDGLPTHALPP